MSAACHSIHSPGRLGHCKCSSHLVGASDEDICGDCTHCPLVSVRVKGNPELPEAFELLYGVAVTEICIKNTVHDMMQSQYWPNHTRFSYSQYIGLARLMIKNAYAMPLLESLNEVLENGKILRVLYPDREVLNATRASPVFLLKELLTVHRQTYNVHGLPGTQLLSI